MVTSAISRMGKSPEEGIKAPVKTSSTVNLVLSGTGQVLNGVTTGTGDRVLVKDQTAPQFNGTYKVGPDAWERTTDMNAADDLANGQLIVDSNTSVVYSITYTGAWSPDITALNFTVLIGSMPTSIVLTNASPIDLVDHNVALITGALDPTNNQHLEYDLESIQSKSDDTTAAILYLNRLGGDVVAAGVSVTAHAAAFVAHAGDATIHFTQAAISITASQVSDFAAAVAATPPAAHTHVSADITDFAASVAANAAVALNTAKISYTDAAAVGLNTAKLTNVPTALSIGTITGTTFGITSDSGADDVVLPVFNSTQAGLSGASGGGTANFQRADGTWAVPPGSGGSNFTAVVEITTARTAAAFEAVFVDDDTAGGVVTITLPAGSADDQILVKKLGTTANVIIDGDTAETIDGALTFTLTAQYASLMLMWNGTEWSII